MATPGRAPATRIAETRAMLRMALAVMAYRMLWETTDAISSAALMTLEFIS
jgi:hypothetical protein